MDALFELLREAESRAAWTPPRALTYEIAARELGISTRQVRRLVATGQIVTCVIGKRPMIPRTEIERMARQYATEAPHKEPPMPHVGVVTPISD